MKKVCWNIIAAIAIVAFSGPAPATQNDSVSDVAGRPAGKAHVERLAQTGAPSTAAPAASAWGSRRRSPPRSIPSRPTRRQPALRANQYATSTGEVARPAPGVTGCALKYLAAEVAGKLKGRKWREFRAEECAGSTTLAVFPSTVAPKYSAEKPEKARVLTCADQFNANKSTNGNGGLKWIEKSGGYYTECVVRLKG